MARRIVQRIRKAQKTNAPAAQSAAGANICHTYAVKP